MTRRPQILVVIASVLVVAGCGGGETAEEPAFPPADSAAQTDEAGPSPSVAPDSTVERVPPSSTVEPAPADETEAAVTTRPPSTVATEEPATTVPTTTEPTTAEPVAEETVPAAPSEPPVSAAEIAALEAQLDEIDALLTDLELDLEQD